MKEAPTLQESRYTEALAGLYSLSRWVCMAIAFCIVVLIADPLLPLSHSAERIVDLKYYPGNTGKGRRSGPKIDPEFTVVAQRHRFNVLNGEMLRSFELGDTVALTLTPVLRRVAGVKYKTGTGDVIFQEPALPDRGYFITLLVELALCIFVISRKRYSPWAYRISRVAIAIGATMLVFMWLGAAR